MNWKTTAIGVGAGVAYLLYKILTRQSLTPDDFILAGGLMGVGHLAKDKDVTGGTRPQ